MNHTADITIIGAGPSGLCAAWYLSDKYSINIIDYNGLGGCHRVEYKDDMILEHGPRVYSEAYINTKKWFNDMGIDMMEYMEPYKSGFWAIAKKMGKNLSIMDFTKLSGYFLMFMLGYNNHNPLISMNLSEEGQEFMDKFCRLTDGAASDTYPIYKFMELINQHPYHNMLIPNRPMSYIFDIMYNKLSNKGVAFYQDKITSIDYENNICIGTNRYLSDKIMLAIPPSNLLNFPNIMDLFNISEQWIKDHKYIWYDSYQIKIPYVVDNSDWGLMNDKYGLIWINMSDYWGYDTMNGTYISAALTDVPENYSAQERKDYVRKTIAKYMDIPYEDITIMNGLSMPSFVEHHEHYDYPECNIGNIYLLGTHTGLSNYAFTSMESAVESTMKCIKKLLPNKINIMARITMRHILVFIVIVVFLLIIISYRPMDYIFTNYNL